MPKLKERNKNINKSLLALSNIDANRKTIWFHSASMGEFEQVKPIIELIKKNQPKFQIVCTFFSPSGYNTQKNYQYADFICYLPNDLYWNAKKFINKINPIFVVFDRYELWLNYLSILHSNHIPTFLVNATTPSILDKTKIFSHFYKAAFNKFTEIFAVSELEFQQFSQLNIDTSISQSADTRIDRIISKVDEAKMHPVIQKEILPNNNLVLVAGSVWNNDVDIINDAYNKFIQNSNSKIKIVFVPHEPTKEHINYIKSKVPNTILLSEFEKNNQNSIIQNKHIIVDSIGKLLKLYSIADYAYIGGAFGVGVHSITEPAGYGIPLITGPNCYNSPDTKPLLNAGALTIINDSDMLLECLLIMNEQNNREIAGNAAKNYININSGTSKIIYKKIIDLINSK
jgi:3-deoxy-D-manno-octulosonic-acid transferase